MAGWADCVITVKGNGRGGNGHSKADRTGPLRQFLVFNTVLFAKIFAHLAETPEFKDLRALWKERLEKVGGASYQFRYEKAYNTSGGTTEKVVRYFKAPVGTGEHQASFGDGGEVYFSVPAGLLLSADELNAVAKTNFGTKRCRTYFCKLEKVLKGDDRKNHKRDGFAEWARKYLAVESAEAMVDAANRVKESIRQQLGSPQYCADMKRFFERQVIDEIRAVVQKYYDKVDPSVVKEALDEVIAHAVMDS